MSEKVMKEYDKNNNLIYFKNIFGFERWYKYDENNNKIHYKNSNNEEYWIEYDKNNRRIHYRDTSNIEKWYEYNKNGDKIDITKEKLEYIEFRKKEREYLSREKVSRFELMDI